MKRFYLLTVMMLALGSAAIAQTKDETEVQALMAVQEAKWNEGDLRGFMEYYWKSDSLKFIGSKGITYGWQKTLENYIKGYPDKEAMGILTFKVIECSQLSDKAVYVIGKWDLKKQKVAGGHFTLLWKKIKGKWVIVADHTS